MPNRSLHAAGICGPGSSLDDPAVADPGLSACELFHSTASR